VGGGLAVLMGFVKFSHTRTIAVTFATTTTYRTFYQSCLIDKAREQSSSLKDKRLHQDARARREMMFFSTNVGIAGVSAFRSGALTPTFLGQYYAPTEAETARESHNHEIEGQEALYVEETTRESDNHEIEGQEAFYVEEATHGAIYAEETTRESHYHEIEGEEALYIEETTQEACVEETTRESHYHEVEGQKALYDAEIAQLRLSHEASVAQLVNHAVEDAEEKENLHQQLLQTKTELAETQASSAILCNHIDLLDRKVTVQAETQQYLTEKVLLMAGSLRDLCAINEAGEAVLKSELARVALERDELRRKLDQMDDNSTTVTSSSSESGIGRTKLKVQRKMKGFDRNFRRGDHKRYQAKIQELETQLIRMSEKEAKRRRQLCQLATSLIDISGIVSQRFGGDDQVRGQQDEDISDHSISTSSSSTTDDAVAGIPQESTGEVYHGLTQECSAEPGNNETHRKGENQKDGAAVPRQESTRDVYHEGAQAQALAPPEENVGTVASRENSDLVIPSNESMGEVYNGFTQKCSAEPECNETHGKGEDQKDGFDIPPQESTEDEVYNGFTQKCSAEPECNETHGKGEDQKDGFDIPPQESTEDVYHEGTQEQGLAPREENLSLEACKENTDLVIPRQASTWEVCYELNQEQFLAPSRPAPEALRKKQINHLSKILIDVRAIGDLTMRFSGDIQGQDRAQSALTPLSSDPVEQENAVVVPSEETSAEVHREFPQQKLLASLSTLPEENDSHIKLEDHKSISVPSEESTGEVFCELTPDQIDSPSTCDKHSVIAEISIGTLGCEFIKQEVLASCPPAPEENKSQAKHNDHNDVAVLLEESTTDRCYETTQHRHLATCPPASQEKESSCSGGSDTGVMPQEETVGMMDAKDEFSNQKSCKGDPSDASRETSPGMLDLSSLGSCVSASANKASKVRKGTIDTDGTSASSDLSSLSSFDSSIPESEGSQTIRIVPDSAVAQSSDSKTFRFVSDSFKALYNLSKSQSKGRKSEHSKEKTAATLPMPCSMSLAASKAIEDVQLETAPTNISSQDNRHISKDYCSAQEESQNRANSVEPRQEKSTETFPWPCSISHFDSRTLEDTSQDMQLEIGPNAGPTENKNHLWKVFSSESAQSACLDETCPSTKILPQEEQDSESNETTPTKSLDALASTTNARPKEEGEEKPSNKTLVVDCQDCDENVQNGGNVGAATTPMLSETSIATLDKNDNQVGPSYTHQSNLFRHTEDWVSRRRRLQPSKIPHRPFQY
jgi:hypothetical protein